MIKNKVKEKKKDTIKELVLARLEIIPSDASVSVGSMGHFSKEQLIDAVKKNDELGKKITEIQLEYLQLLKKGILYEDTSYGKTVL